jgi:hypothetical protein
MVVSTLLFNVLVHSSNQTEFTPATELSPPVIIGSSHDSLLDVDPATHVYMTESSASARDLYDSSSTFSAAAGTSNTISTRVIEYAISNSNHDEAASSATQPFDDSSYQNYISKATNTYKSLAGHRYKHQNITLEQYMQALSQQPECAAKPVFMTMARVSSDLYWQLIENFFHTMYYFNNVVSSFVLSSC